MVGSVGGFGVCSGVGVRSGRGALDFGVERGVCREDLDRDVVALAEPELSSTSVGVSCMLLEAGVGGLGGRPGGGCPSVSVTGTRLSMSVSGSLSDIGIGGCDGLPPVIFFQVFLAKSLSSSALSVSPP